MENRSKNKFFKFLFVLICILLLLSLFLILFFFRETNLLKTENKEITKKERRTQIELQHLKKNFENLETMVKKADTVFVERRISDTTADADFFVKIEENQKLLKQKEEQFLLSVKRVNKILAELSREKGNSALFEKKYDKALFHYMKSIDYSDNLSTRVALMELKRILSNKDNTLIGHEERVNSIALTGDDKILASADFNGIIKIWDLEKQKLLKSITTDGYSINSLKFIDNSTLIYAGDNKLIKIIDIDKNSIIKTLKGHTGNITSIDWLAKKQIIASASLDKTVKIWNIENEDPLYNLTNHIERVNTVRFSYNGNYLATGSKDNNIFIYDTESFKQVKKFKVHQSGVNDLIFDKTGKYIITATGSYFGGEDFQSKLIDINEERVTKIFNEHYDYVTNLVFFGVGDIFFLSGSSDFTVKAWGGETEDSLFTFRGHTDYVNRILVTSDSKYIISCSSDKTIKVWETGIDEDINSIKKTLKNYILD